MNRQMKNAYFDTARNTLKIYHEQRVISYENIMNGIKKYIADYSDFYDIIGNLTLNDSKKILAKQKGKSLILDDDIYVIPVDVILKFWEKYVTPDEICHNVIQWYFDTYQNGYTLNFKS